MERNCPVCFSDKKELLYTYTLTSGANQHIYACNPCSMVFASTPKVVDYSHSIYEAQGAIGSGVSVHDHERLDQVAETVRVHCTKGARILDVGCGQGGLLAALERKGLGKQTGLDPSAICCGQTAALGYPAITGYLSSVTDKYDFITLSHVLEHIPDAEAFLCEVVHHLAPFGKVYIEVPNAARYADYSASLPFLDFNSEHINHFEMDTLLHVLERCGLNGTINGFKEIALTSGMKYPTIWVVAERNSTYFRVTKYIRNSQIALENANRNIEKALGSASEIAIWGAGEYLAHILSLPAIASREVIQIVDRNPALHGETIGGCKVGSPASLTLGLPVVIAAIVAGPAIRKEAEAMGLTAVTLEFQ